MDTNLSSSRNKLLAGKKLSFQFYRDEGGRLRCLCPELGIRKPVEKADGSKRYKFLKVMGLPLWLSQRIDKNTLLRLQTAEEGETVEVEL